MTTLGPLAPAAGNPEARILDTVPILASLDLAASIRFYTGRLGFVLIAQFDDYAIVKRDGCELHFYSCDNALIAQNTSCYLRTSDAEALYQEFRSRGADLSPPEARPWGMKEMYVLDPHGNLLKFGEPA